MMQSPEDFEDPDEIDRPSDAREPLERLAAEFADRQRRGESPSLIEYTREYPELATDICDIFPVVARLEQLKRTRDCSSRSKASAGLPRTTYLGSFKLLRKIGRGGMGVVYLAEDQNLKRIVALKILGASIADSVVQLQRFRHEAESAARLHHPNIVPVFGTGSVHGVHFYVMQFVNGYPLSTLIETLHKKFGQEATVPPVADAVAERLTNQGWRNWKIVAKKVLDLADALAYAHSQGVLHRDVKPANVLVDRTGHVWIADFGLATHDDQTRVTHTGELVGTLQYMAPEQLRAECDVRSDVYSLGLTLFELLTLRPAFNESHYGPLLRLKTTTPVASPRTIEPSIPTDLDTIVLKACALDPADRYQSAAELREDLRCFVEDRPIRARRASWGEQIWRWSKRNPVVAGLTSLACLLVAAVAFTFVAGSYGINKALQQAIDSKQLAEHNLQLAVKALDEIMTNVSERGIPQTLHVGIGGEEASLQDVVVTEADAALLKSLLRFFDEFATQNGTNLNRQTALAHQRIGDILQRLGKLSDAESAYQQALAYYRHQAIVGNNDAALTFQRAALWNKLGTVRAQAGHEDASIDAHEAALRMLESSADAMNCDQGRFQVAQTLILLGSLGSRTGGGEMVGGIGKAPPADRNLANPDHSERTKSPVNHDTLRQSERPETRIEHDHAPLPRHEHRGLLRITGMKPLTRAIEILQELLTRDSDNAAYQFSLASICRLQIRRNHESSPQAIAEIHHAAHESIAILRRLVDRSPENAMYVYELANALCRAGYRVTDFELAERERCLKEAVQLADRLHSSHPHVSEYQALLASTERRLAEFEESQQIPDVAEGRYQRALDLQEQLATQYPSMSLYQLGYAQMLSEWAQMQSHRRQDEVARRSIDQAITIVRRSAAIWGDDQIYHEFLAHLEAKAQALHESALGN